MYAILNIKQAGPSSVQVEASCPSVPANSEYSNLTNFLSLSPFNTFMTVHCPQFIFENTEVLLKYISRTNIF